MLVRTRGSNDRSGRYSLPLVFESPAPPVKIQRKQTEKSVFFVWSERGDSNTRPLGPEQIRHRFLTTFVDFLVLFSPKTMLSDALVRTVST